MIHTIGAVHAALRAKKPAEDEINFRVEVTKRRSGNHSDDDGERPRHDRTERGLRA